MQFTFIDMAGKTLFIRDDAERAQWTQEEMSLDAEFPRLDDKVISIGQRVLFKDPSTGTPHIYEIKQAQTVEPDNYQSIVAENICISELTDEHIDNQEITDKTAQNALQTVLQGTQWQVGTVAVNPVSSVDISRGNVWQAILDIKDNWNVYIEPRVTINASGAITRYLDIASTDGTWNGVRLSIDKNMLDPSVTFDDSGVLTAMYGYGGTTTPTKKDEEAVEITFADVVWAKTSAHPAKPRGQKYIEDPTATAEYGRNGRARFGFYQNTDILDPNVLLQKTWESLQAVSKPAISVDGTVADLYRMGYADQPIKLHDIALVEVNPAGYKQQIQIIRMTTDLLDPSATTLTIGSYIPNIVYIERQTYEDATGTRGGGKNSSNQSVRSEYETAINKNNRMIQLRAYQNDLDDLDNEVKLQEAQITVEHNRITQEVTDRRDADNILNANITVQANRITQEVTERKADTTTLASRITVEAGRITQEVSDRRASYDALDSRITQTADSITAEVTRASRAEGQLASRLTITENAITQEVTRATAAEGTLSGRITTTADAITAEVTRATTAENTLDGKITVEAGRITQEVTDRTNADTVLDGKITVEAGRITQEVTDRTNADTTLDGKITVEAGRITQEVTRATTAEGTLSGRITTEADRISLVVEGSGSSAHIKPASIVTAINNSSSSVTISADKILLDGGVTIDGFLQSDNGSLYVKTDLVIAPAQKISTKTIAMQNNGAITFPDPGGNVGTMTLNNGNIATFFTDLQVVSSGNNYKLQYKSMSETSWTDLPNSTFSRAVSSWVWGGGNGNVNVTALPQNQTKSVPVSINGSNSITSNGTYTYDVYYENADGDDMPTGASKTITVSVSNAISSWTWGGSNGNVNVTALPQNQTKSVPVSVNGSNSITANGSYTYAVYYENSDGDDMPTGASMTVTVNVPDAHTHNLSITRTQAGRSSSGQDIYYGKLYYWDDDAQSYEAAYSSNAYWYRSSTNLGSGSKTVYY